MCTPGWSHIPPLKRQHLQEYWLFWATMDGCFTCVEYYLGEARMNPRSHSSPGNLTLMDFALWGEQLGKPNASAMQSFLRERCPDIGSRSTECSACVPWLSHLPPLGKRHRSEEYLFQAAQDGCKWCVECLLLDGGLDVYSRSFTEQRTALDFAKSASEQGVKGASEVVRYLTEEMYGSTQEVGSTMSGELPPLSS